MTTPNDNPFMPPAEAESPPVTPVEDGGLATRGQRLAGSMIDGALGTISFLVGFAIHRAGFDPFPQDPAIEKLGWEIASPMLGLIVSWPLLGLQWWLIARHAQSVGKIAVHTRIVDLSGRPADFFHGAVLRMLPIMLLSWIPIVLATAGVLRSSSTATQLLSWLAIIDSLFIFRADRRCLHDLIAGTKVIALDR